LVLAFDASPTEIEALGPMEKIVLVHLSDIHFSKSSGSVHDLDSDLRNEILRDAENLITELGAATGVVVTGDIAYSGKKEEFDRAGEWLIKFCGAVQCREESVWVCPGNHDVNRELTKKKSTKTHHDNIRGKGAAAVDTELRETLSDSQSASALLDPLSDYNDFAARFECKISADKHFWEKDLVLSCGTIFRLRGLCSVLVSNGEDEKGNIVLGSVQATVPRVDGVNYLTLCHHPPDWLLDQDHITVPLEKRVRIQLFGHKHLQMVQIIDGMLRVTAGAMHPERTGQVWDPAYNVIVIDRRDTVTMGVRLYQRQWDKAVGRFAPLRDSDSGASFRDMTWQSAAPVPGHPARRIAVMASAPIPEHPATIDNAVIPKGNEAMPEPNYKRRLTFRFLGLSFRNQISIANALGVLTDEDRALSHDALFRVLFERALQMGRLATLWDETEKKYADRSPTNPFENPK
jgi:predicted phosphodiesterase